MYVGIGILDLVKSKSSCFSAGNTQNTYILSKYRSQIPGIIFVQINSHITLPGPDYFNEGAKYYSRLFAFFQVTFCHSRQWGRQGVA